MKERVKIAAMVIMALVVVSTATGDITYVDDDAVGANDGSSWINAYIYLQDALATAQYGDEIRVAEGIYKPDQGAGVVPGDREATFQLINGVTLKGGYAGFGEPEPNDRDIELYETILSGDLVGNDLEVSDPCDLINEPTRSENSYHVVTTSGTNASATLDGFIITGGNANVFPLPEGGGVYNIYGSPTLMNCTIISNSASYGGAMYNEGSWERVISPTLTNCTFTRNWANHLGGAIYEKTRSNPTLTNCTFSRNSSGGSGGGIHNRDGSNPTLTNCTFTDNSASRVGGAIENRSFSSPTLINCTFNINSAREGGAILSSYDNTNITLIKCNFTANSARWGGALELYAQSTLNCCAFITNSAMDSGGAIYLDGQSTISSCLFSGNAAAGYGAGICNRDGTTLTLNHCTFTGNSAGQEGGGIYYPPPTPPVPPPLPPAFSPRSPNLLDYPALAQLTITDDISGYSVSNGIGETSYKDYRKLSLNNCILWSNRDAGGTDESAQVHLCQPVQEINYSCLRGWTGDLGGTANIDTDPCFIQSGCWDVNGAWVEGDYHLPYDSPCVDSGDPNYIAEPNETDLDGNPRVKWGRIDMGAYEYDSIEIVAEVDFVPNTLNLNNKGKWLTAFIQLPEDYSVSEIEPNSVLLEDSIQAASLLVDEQKQVAIARFSRENVQSILNIGEVELTISGQLTDRTIFKGADVIRVVQKSGGKPDKYVQASDPNPVDGETNVSITADLNWTAGPYAISHDVYFGTSNPPPFISNQEEATFDPGTMDYETRYYWRIDEVSKWGVTTGDVWSFTTIEAPPPPPPPPAPLPPPPP